MVSNNEIKRKLTDKREGQNPEKKKLNEDWTPSIDEIKKKLKNKMDIKNMNYGYLVIIV